MIPLSSSEVDYPLLRRRLRQLAPRVGEPRCMRLARARRGVAPSLRRRASVGARCRRRAMAAGRSLAETIQARGSTREFSGEAIARRGLCRRALYHATRGLARGRAAADWWISTSASTPWTASRRAPTPTIPDAHALELHQARRRARRNAAFLCLDQPLGGMSSRHRVLPRAISPRSSTRSAIAAIALANLEAGPDRRPSLSRRLRPALRCHRPHLLRRRGRRVLLAPRGRQGRPLRHRPRPLAGGP